METHQLSVKHSILLFFTLHAVPGLKDNSLQNSQKTKCSLGRIFVYKLKIHITENLYLANILYIVV